MSAPSPQVQKAFRKVRDAGCEGISPICHGNAWSVYFQDPEGNRIEMFCDTPWYVPQPLGFKIDLDKPEDELFRETEAYCRDARGVQADRGMAGRDRQEDRGQARSVRPRLRLSCHTVDLKHAVLPPSDG